jgi:hypothetical protein
LDEKRRFGWKAALRQVILPCAMSAENVELTLRMIDAFNPLAE